MSKTDPLEPILVDRAGAARLLSLSERTITELVRAGKLEPVRVGRAVRFRVSDLEGFAARGECQGG